MKTWTVIFKEGHAKRMETYPHIIDAVQATVTARLHKVAREILPYKPLEVRK